MTKKMTQILRKKKVEIDEKSLENLAEAEEKSLENLAEAEEKSLENFTEAEEIISKSANKKLTVFYDGSKFNPKYFEQVMSLKKAKELKRRYNDFEYKQGIGGSF